MPKTLVTPSTAKAWPKDLLIGSHMSIAGGMVKSLERGESIGCTAIQVFVKGNTRWEFPPLKDEDAQKFRDKLKTSPIKSVIAHSIYLVNLASDKPEFIKKSLDDLVDELDRCERLTIPGLVLHPGAHCGAGEKPGIDKIAAGLNEVFSRTDGMKAKILLETTAGQGSCLGRTFEELAAIIESVKKPERIGICLDTCHVFSAGYDIRTGDGYASLWNEFNKVLDRKLLMGIHINDSKNPLGSRKDRHEHIGKGTLGLEPFRLLVNDKALRGVPLVLETEKDPEMTEDVMNLEVLRSLLS
jgi:deoxyribonuclease IV